MKGPRAKRATRRLKVYFSLEPDESGYPPAKAEFLWCMPTKKRTYIVDNIPFFARDISLGDEITAKKAGRVLRFCKLVRASKNSTVRVLMKKSDKTESTINKLKSLGCGAEALPRLSLLAVSIPPKAATADALSFLDKEAEAGNVGIEESAVRYQ